MLPAYDSLYIALSQKTRFKAVLEARPVIGLTFDAMSLADTLMNAKNVRAARRCAKAYLFPLAICAITYTSECRLGVAATSNRMERS